MRYPNIDVRVTDQVISTVDRNASPLPDIRITPAESTQGMEWLRSVRVDIGTDRVRLTVSVNAPNSDEYTNVDLEMGSNGSIRLTR